MSKSFTHCHVHTEYSMLDGASRLEELVAAAVEDGQPALGITDHGNMYGVLPFYKECKKQGIKPIIGSELYMAQNSRFERPNRKGKSDDTGGETSEGKKVYYHLTALAENNTGYKNLMRLSSQAFMEGYYYKPRVDWELLEKYHEGIIATTGCLGGQVLQALMKNNYKEGLAIAGRLQDIFGKDNLFIELQDHGIPEQLKTNPQLIEISRAIDAPLIATNDSHYTRAKDALGHDALLCLQTGSFIDDPNRFKFHDGDNHYLKTAEEMRYLFSEVETACDSTLWIAERADVDIEFHNSLLPDFPLPKEFTSDADYLAYLTYEGAKQRWGDALPMEVIDRLEDELSIIMNMEFSSYFLIVWDLIKFAKDNDIRIGPGRGSAAGCAVSYALNITDLDPVKYDLLFERFLNPSRVSMPDIDVDVDTRYRETIINYLAEKYGRDRVAQIITFSTIKARAAVRDSARVLGYPFAVGDKIAKAMPPLLMGRDTPLAACLVEDPDYKIGFEKAYELRQMIEDDPEVAKVVEVAKGLENLRRQDGIHAAAVVITKDSLVEHVPIQRKPDKDGVPSPIVTQYEMNSVEELGLLKMDILGLRNLDIITDTIKLIHEEADDTFDLSTIPLDDEQTLSMLRRGYTTGVFQLESTPMRSLVRALAPTSFDDIAALIALYRPGPMSVNMHNDYADRKNGRQSVLYMHHESKEYLESTYGLMIYQEEMMRIAQKYAGYSLAEADNLRKACGKKKPELMKLEKDKFIDGCKKTGYEQLGQPLFSIIEGFADYAFNKSHSYGYGLISYQTAYLKTHYPLQYMASILTSHKDSIDKNSLYLNECKKIGIKVLTPDVNISFSDFIPVSDNEIAFGLSAIKNVGESIAQKISAEREAHGPYKDFFDFCERVELVVLNKKALEALIKVGVFDSFGLSRNGLLVVFEQLVARIVKDRKKETQGMVSLFDMAEIDDRTIPDLPFGDINDQWLIEKENLGLYLSGHPLDEARKTLKTDYSLAEALAKEDGSWVFVLGVVNSLNRKWTKKGDPMAFFTFEDEETMVEAIIFPKLMKKHTDQLKDGSIMLVKARIDNAEGDKLIIQDIKEIR